MDTGSAKQTNKQLSRHSPPRFPVCPDVFTSSCENGTPIAEAPFYSFAFAGCCVRTTTRRGVILEKQRI